MRKLLTILLLIGTGSVVGQASGLPPILVIAAMGAMLVVVVKSGALPEGSLPMAFTDLTWPSGKQNMAGLVGDIYYCPVTDILTYPALSAALALDTANASNFVCKTGKNFIKIYHTADTGKLEDSTVGDRDGKSKENHLEFFFPGSDKAVAEFERQALNTPCVVICKDTDGNLRVLGAVNLDSSTTVLSGEIPAFLDSANGTLGGARADKRGKTFSFKHNAPHAPIFYKGSVPLTPAP
jgi:hypothetical protein